MEPGALAYSFHRISPHIVEIGVRRLSDYKNSYELVSTLADAVYGTSLPHDLYQPPLIVTAHEGYYKAGILHGDISTANICIFEGKQDDGERRKTVTGALLDLEQCQSCETFLPVSMKLEDTAEADID